MDQTLLGIGTRLQHTRYGPGVIVINSHKKLTDEEKVNLQQYITRVYGSFTRLMCCLKIKGIGLRERREVNGLTNFPYPIKNYPHYQTCHYCNLRMPA